jgi:hypothetical protein
MVLSGFTVRQSASINASFDKVVKSLRHGSCIGNWDVDIESITCDSRMWQKGDRVQLRPRTGALKSLQGEITQMQRSDEIYYIEMDFERSEGIVTVAFCVETFQHCDGLKCMVQQEIRYSGGFLALFGFLLNSEIKKERKMSMANMKSYFEYRSLPYNIQNYLKQKQMK